MCSDDSAVKFGITNINTSSENSRLTGRDLPNKLSPACSMCLLLHHSKKDSGVACYCLRDPPKVLWGAAGRGPLGRVGFTSALGCLRQEGVGEALGGVTRLPALLPCLAPSYACPFALPWEEVTGWSWGGGSHSYKATQALSAKGISGAGEGTCRRGCGE